MTFSFERRGYSPPFSAPRLLRSTTLQQHTLSPQFCISAALLCLVASSGVQASSSFRFQHRPSIPILLSLCLPSSLSTQLFLYHSQLTLRQAEVVYIQHLSTAHFSFSRETRRAQPASEATSSGNEDVVSLVPRLLLHLYLLPPRRCSKLLRTHLSLYLGV